MYFIWTAVISQKNLTSLCKLYHSFRTMLENHDELEVLIPTIVTCMCKVVFITQKMEKLLERFLKPVVIAIAATVALLLNTGF